MKTALKMIALGLAAVWISNNVSFVRGLVGPRLQGPVI